MNVGIAYAWSGRWDKKDKLRRLKFALLLTSLGMVVEFVGGILSNSLALISDAGHMLTHLFALGMSYFAIILSWRPADKKRTYGFYRAEVLAVFINGIVLLFILRGLPDRHSLTLLRYLPPWPPLAGSHRNFVPIWSRSLGGIGIFPSSGKIPM